eukprot:8306862-Alexandrium_andersonii.AAC.1
MDARRFSGRLLPNAPDSLRLCRTHEGTYPQILVEAALEDAVHGRVTELEGRGEGVGRPRGVLGLSLIHI